MVIPRPAEQRFALFASKPASTPATTDDRLLDEHANRRSRAAAVAYAALVLSSLNRLILMDPREETEIRAPRFWTFRWDTYRVAGEIDILPKWLSQCTVADLEPISGKTHR